MVTAEIIKTKVSTDRRWTERAILAIYRFQTMQEQETLSTREHNKVGFNAFDAEILSSFAEHLLRGQSLTYKQLALAFKKMPKYASQLARIANEGTETQPATVQGKDISNLLGTGLVYGDSIYVELSVLEHALGTPLPEALAIHNESFVFDSVVKDQENDLLYIKYKSVSTSKVLIIEND